MKMKTFVVALFATMMITTLFSSALLNRVYYKEEKLMQSLLPVEVTQTDSSSTNMKKLNAILKGSIYESGEQMTVFGACFDGYGYLIPDSTAKFNSWYPNGSIWESNMSMLPVLNTSGNTTGRFRYQVNMTTTGGTYLTEIVCEYLGDTAVAYGEWQNPDWVNRIAQIQNQSLTYYSSLSSQITNFSNDVQSNFSQVMVMLGNLTVSLNSTQSANLNASELVYYFSDVYNAVKSIDPTYWVIDTEWPFSVLGNGTFSGIAVDMLNKNDIYVVAQQASGNAYIWDGSTWSALSGTIADNINDVSVVPASSPYAWFVTDSGYSINGAAITTISGEGSSVYYAVKAFQRNPGESIMGYVVNDAGEVWFTNDDATTWSNVHTFTSTSGTIDADVSNVLWYDNGLDVNNYRVAVTSGADDYMLYYNGSTYVTVNAGSGILLRGVTLLRDDLGYVLGDDAGVGVVYQFDGQNLTEVFRTNTSVRSVDAVSPNDIWVVGDSPMGFYHYNGFNWQHSYYPYSAGIIINVDQNLTLANIKDVVLVDAKTGYAISDNGVLLKLQSNYDQKFDALIAQVQNQSLVLGLLQYMNTTLTSMNTTLTNVSLTNQQIYNYVQAMNVTLYDIQGNVLSINQTVNNIQTSLNNMNITLLDIQNTVNSINTSVYDLTQIVTNMNNSVLANLTYIEDFLASMNATINAQLTQIIANQTYMQLYLETTMYPMINATYQNTLLILSQLGLIDYKLNQTIEIANNTLTLVNETKVGVDELVNKSRRIRAWITV